MLATLNTVMKAVPTEAPVVGNREKRETIEVRSVLREWTKFDKNANLAAEIIERLEAKERSTEYIAQSLAVVALYELGRQSWAASAQATGCTTKLTQKAGADTARSRYIEAYGIQAEKTSAATTAGKERREAMKVFLGESEEAADEAPAEEESA